MSRHLQVLKGKPDEVFPKLWKEWGISKLCFEVDTEPYAKQRDTKMAQLAKDAGTTSTPCFAAEEGSDFVEAGRCGCPAGVEVITRVGHTLYDSEELVKLNGGKPPATMGQFEKLVKQAGEAPMPAADPPQKFPPMPEQTQSKDTAVPSLKDLGYPTKATTPFKASSIACLLPGLPCFITRMIHLSFS